MERIAITTTSFAVADTATLDLLAARGAEVVRNELGRALDPEETIALLAGCVGVVAGTERYSREILEALPSLRVISRVGVGTDAIDADAARDLAVTVRNTPDGPTRAVAELALALALDLLRHTSRMDRELRAGRWKKRNGNLVLGRRVGVVGLGRIGRTVAGLFAALGAEVAYCDICEPASDVPYASLPLRDLLAWADLVTLHCTASGAHLIGAEEIALMRPGAWLVNTSRGTLVDEDALAEALRTGRLGGAALDVYASEPYTGPLTRLENVVLTPHVGSYAVESRVEMELQAVRNLIEELARPEGTE